MRCRFLQGCKPGSLVFQIKWDTKQFVQQAGLHAASMRLVWTYYDNGLASWDVPGTSLQFVVPPSPFEMRPTANVQNRKPRLQPGAVPAAELHCGAWWAELQTGPSGQIVGDDLGVGGGFPCDAKDMP